MSENAEIIVGAQDKDGSKQPRALVALDPIDNLLAQANVLVRSDLLPPHIRKPEQAVAIMLRGRELGIGPMEALTSLNFIKGKVSSSTQLMLALIYRSGMLEDIEMVRGDPARVTMKRKEMTAHTASFGSEDAQRAGLRGRDNYQKYPEIMYLWRAIAICARVVFPDVVGAVYTPDELGVSLRSDAELLEVDWRAVDEEMQPPPPPDPTDPTVIARVREMRGDGTGAPFMSFRDIVEATGLKLKDVMEICRTGRET